MSEPINLLEQQADSEGIWRRHVNHCLKEHYQPLYEKMNFWLWLKAPSFELVYRWRLEQEHNLAQQLELSTAPQLMNDQQVHTFIQHFQRLTEHSLQTMPAHADVVFHLDEDRRVVKVVHGD